MGNDKQSTAHHLLVGMTASLTGRYSLQGTQALAGAQTWVEDVSLSGGLRFGDGENPLPVRLIYFDDESDAQRCGGLTERLIVEDKVDILLGPYSSGLTLRAASVAERYQRVLWNHGGAAERIHRSGYEWVVSILTPTSRYFHGVIDFVLHTRPSTRSVGIVSSTAGAFPREVAAGAESYCKEKGFEAVPNYRYTAGTTDFDPILRRLADDQPDLILEVGRIEDDINFARQLVQSGARTGSVGLIVASIALFKEALGDAVEGFLGPSQWEPGVTATADYGPSPEEVFRSLSKRWPSGVDYPMAQAYAGCLAAQKCIEAAETLDNSALRRAANELDFTTFYGRFNIDPSTGRQLGHIMPVVQWQHGEKVVVWPRR